MEIFTFLKSGAPLSSLTCLHIDGGEEPTTAAVGDAQDIRSQHMRLAMRFATFDVSKAKCFKEEERQRLLAVIESAFGSAHVFNSLIRGLIQLDAAPTQTRKASCRTRAGSMSVNVSDIEQRQHSAPPGALGVPLPQIV